MERKRLDDEYAGAIHWTSVIPCNTMATIVCGREGKQNSVMPYENLFARCSSHSELDQGHNICGLWLFTNIQGEKVVST